MRRRAAITTAVVAVALVAWVPVASGDADSAPCRLSPPGTSVSVDQAFTDLFAGYGDDNTLLDDWTGADGAFSVALPDGRVLWSFSDTFLGLVNPDESRPPGQPFINNDFVIQDGDTLVATLHGGTQEEPASLVAPTDGADWYWMGAGATEGEHVRAFLSKFVRFGPGAWDWKWVGTDIGSWSLPDLTFEGTTPAVSENGVMYGIGLFQDASYTYVYGVEDHPWHNYLHVARAPNGGLLGSWEFFTGSGWSTDPADTGRTLDGIGTTMGLVKVGRTFVLVTFDGNVPFGNEIVLYTSCRPSGPWGHRTHLYDAPEGNGRWWAYNVKVHPEAWDGSGLLVTYDVNTTKPIDLLHDVNSYRPRFLRVVFSGHQ